MSREYSELCMTIQDHAAKSELPYGAGLMRGLKLMRPGIHGAILGTQYDPTLLAQSHPVHELGFWAELERHVDHEVDGPASEPVRSPFEGQPEEDVEEAERASQALTAMQEQTSTPSGRRAVVNEVLEQWIIENGLDRRREVRREEDRRALADLIAAARQKGLIQ